MCSAVCVANYLKFKICSSLTCVLCVWAAGIKKAVCFVAIEAHTGLVGGNCSKDRHGVGRRNLEVVCEGKAWISSFRPIPGVYGNSNETSIAVFGHQNSVKMRYMVISTWTFHVKIHIPKTALSGSGLCSESPRISGRLRQGSQVQSAAVQSWILSIV